MEHNNTWGTADVWEVQRHLEGDDRPCLRHAHRCGLTWAVPPPNAPAHTPAAGAMPLPSAALRVGAM